MSDLCQNAAQGVLNPECYGSCRALPCLLRFSWPKWTSNNMDKSKNLHLIERKMSKMS